MMAKMGKHVTYGQTWRPLENKINKIYSHLQTIRSDHGSEFTVNLSAIFNWPVLEKKKKKKAFKLG